MKMFLGKPNQKVIDWCKKKFPPVSQALKIATTSDFHKESAFGGWGTFNYVNTQNQQCNIGVEDNIIANQILASDMKKGSNLTGTSNGEYTTAQLIINGITYDGSFQMTNVQQDVMISYFHVCCLLEGTKIKLSNGTEKKIEDITYEDEILTYDFDEGKTSSRKPVWVKKPQIIGNKYRKYILQSGKTLDVVIGHRAFSVNKNRFETLSKCVGDTIILENGQTDVVLEEQMVEVDPNNMPKYYNVITDHDFNLYANGILTSCRLNNMYSFENGKFVKDGTTKHTIEEFNGDISQEDFDKYRISEQTYSVEELKSYVQRLNYFKT